MDRQAAGYGMVGYLYILQSQKNLRFYIGSTSDYVRRFTEHNNGKSRYTRLTRPWKLVYVRKYKTLKEARQAEYAFKRQKSRIIIENLIKEWSGNPE